MLDRWTSKAVAGMLRKAAGHLQRWGVRPDQVTVCGFLIGLLAVPLLVLHWYPTALCAILLNRLADGLDGSLARLGTVRDSGGYLDICLDFIFYAAVIFGFALADPAQNALAAAALIFTFIGTGGSFLAFAIMAERRNLPNLHFPHKGFYYLGGLAEGTETIILLVLCCLFPASFPILAWVFAGICLLTAITRVIGGYSILLGDERQKGG